ncbi:hypothetical protein GALMADRAFT_253053 [Galerina marginata CBS 339.88]|uniref:Uncharacterized protein n=1 Tax=Galerina marginata (strain CBS 339.88) TaxID=685588 RepID=A0A067SZM4_GALM3|nr:hypothetical protein GALMADRAFT_253053 [Galerina marginata CBS 339.88]
MTTMKPHQKASTKRPMLSTRNQVERLNDQILDLTKSDQLIPNLHPRAFPIPPPIPASMFTRTTPLTSVHLLARSNHRKHRSRNITPHSTSLEGVFCSDSLYAAFRASTTRQSLTFQGLYGCCACPPPGSPDLIVHIQHQESLQAIRHGVPPHTSPAVPETD